MQSESREVWAKRVAGFEASGLNAPSYAREIRVNARTLKWWRSRFRAEAEAKSKRTPKPLSFVDVSAAVAQSNQQFEIVLRGGARIRVPDRFDEATLSRLIDLLEARC